MGAKSAIGSAAAGIMLLALGTIAVGSAGYAGNLLIPMVWASYSKQLDRMEAEQARGERIRQEGNAEYASRLCPAYKAASLWDKTIHMRNLAWCSSYEQK